MATFTERIIRAAKLDADLYEEVEADHNATGQAMAVVVLSSVAAGIGSLRSFRLLVSNPRGELSGLFFAALAALLGWVVWALLTYWIGTQLLPEPQTSADLGEMLRTIGFSSSPGILGIFGAVPLLGPLFALVAIIWMLVAMVVAVRQALDYQSTTRAFGVCAIGWTIVIVVPYLASAYVR